MDLLSPRFVLNAILDEIAEKRGVYWKSPSLHRTHYLDECALALQTDGFGGIPYVMWGKHRDWRGDAYPATGGVIFWVRVDSLDDFVREVLPRIHAPVVLVTGASDYSPLEFAPKATEALLQSEMISHWFCAQPDFPVVPKKVTPVPLGLPYPYRNDIHFAKPWYALTRHITKRYDIAAHDRRLAMLVRNRVPPELRPPLAFCDFALNNTSRDGRLGETRAGVAEVLKRSGCCVFPEKAMQPMLLYKTYGEYAFVVSPFGRAMDCYRTWEALVMGAIPIVRRSPLEPMFKGLPVAIVDDWNEVTSERLAEWAAQFKDSCEDNASLERLTLDHWLKTIRAAAHQS